MKVISTLSYGGAETQAIGLSKELAKQGHQVTIITTTSYTPRAHMLKNSGVKLISLNKDTKLDFKLIYQLRKVFIKHQPDIIHAYLYDAEFYSQLAAVGLNIPVINSERSDQYQLNLNQRIGNWLTQRLIFGIIANSYSGRQHAAKIHPNLAAEHLMVVWNGIDLDAIKSHNESPNIDYKTDWFGNPSVKLAVMVASIKPAKNYKLALAVAGRLISQDPAWRVVFIGAQLLENKDNYNQHIQRLYEEMNEHEKICFLGNREDVIEILSQADASFLTSLHEGFPNTVLESMAVGTPVVTTDVSDIKQILPEPWLVQDDNDPDAFAHAIVRAAKEKSRLSKKCSQWVHDHCSIKKSTENLLHAYNHFQDLYH